MRAGAVLCLAATAAIALWLTGCGGFNIQSPDLFVLTRTGQGPKLTMLVNDSGTISCDGEKPKPISDSRLIQARDLADDLVKDASHRLTIPTEPGAVYYYRIRVQQGTVSFPDRAAPGHKDLEEAELFAVQAATQACRVAG